MVEWKGTRDNRVKARALVLEVRHVVDPIAIDDELDAIWGSMPESTKVSVLAGNGDMYAEVIKVLEQEQRAEATVFSSESASHEKPLSERIYWLSEDNKDVSSSSDTWHGSDENKQRALSLITEVRGITDHTEMEEALSKVWSDIPKATRDFVMTSEDDMYYEIVKVLEAEQRRDVR